MSKPKKLKQLGEDDVIKAVPQKSDIKKIKEPFFSLSGSIKNIPTTPLVELEIAFRKCKEGGVFS